MKQLLHRFTFILMFLIATTLPYPSYATNTIPQELLSDDLPEEQKSVILEKLLSPVKQKLTDHIKHLHMKKTRTSKTLTGHQDRVNSVCFSPDGKLASASKDGSIKIWDAKTGTLLRSLTEHQEPVTSVCFSPNGRLLASASSSGTVTVWNTDTGIPLHSLTGHRIGVNSVCFSPNGELLASASDDCIVTIWNTNTGALLHSLIGHQDAATSVCFSPDGELLASGSLDCTVNIWNTETGTLRHSVIGHNKNVTSVCFSPNKELLAAGTSKTLDLRDAKTGLLRYALTEHQSHVTSVSRLEEMLRTIEIFPEAMAAEIGYAATELHKLQYDIWLKSICFHPDGELLASASSDGTVNIWNTKTKVIVCSLKGHQIDVNSVCFSPNGELLASASDDLTIKIWNVYDQRDKDALEILNDPDRLDLRQKMLLYVLSKIELKKRDRVNLAINLQKTEQALKKAYPGQPISTLLNLKQSYESLPTTLKEVIQDYFHIIE